MRVKLVLINAIFFIFFFAENYKDDSFRNQILVMHRTINNLAIAMVFISLIALVYHQVKKTKKVIDFCFFLQLFLLGMITGFSFFFFITRTETVIYSQSLFLILVNFIMIGSDADE